MEISEASGCMCMAVRRASRRLTQIYDAALAPAGITINQFGILSYLFGYGALPVGRAAELLGMDATTVNRLVRPLQAARLLTVAASKQDRRVRLLTLSEDGRMRVKEAFPRWQAAQEAVRVSLSAETAKTLNVVLARASEVDV